MYEKHIFSQVCKTAYKFPDCELSGKLQYVSSVLMLPPSKDV